MADAESNQPSKKRTAGVQLTRDNTGLDEDNEDASNLQEGGTFKRASDDVLATRRIVKVRRQQTPSTPAPPISNPFAAIRLVPPPSSVDQADDLRSESETNEPKGEKCNAREKADLRSDKQTEGEAGDDVKHKPNNADKDNESDGITKTLVKSDARNDDADKDDESDGITKTLVEGDAKNEDTEGDNEENEVNGRKGVKDGENEEKEIEDDNCKKNTETASFSSFKQLSSGQNAFSGLAATGFSTTSFSFGTLSKDSFCSSTSIFGNSSAVSKNEGSKLQEICVETGEEDEHAVFTADSVLFEFVDGGWKERGKGEVKVNVSSTSGSGKARLVMRAQGNYRLILNASLFPDIKLTNMDKKGITFACVNTAAEGKAGLLSTIALKFRAISFVEDFKAAVMEHKGSRKSSDVLLGLKTPENSPKAK